MFFLFASPCELEKVCSNQLLLDLKNLQLPTSSLGLHSGPQGKISETASPAPQTVLSTDPSTGLLETQSA